MKKKKIKHGSRRKKHFRKTKVKGIEKVLAAGRLKGHLTYDEINELLPKSVVTSEEIDIVVARLESENISLV